MPPACAARRAVRAGLAGARARRRRPRRRHREPTTTRSPTLLQRPCATAHGQNASRPRRRPWPRRRQQRSPTFIRLIAEALEVGARSLRRPARSYPYADVAEPACISVSTSSSIGRRLGAGQPATSTTVRPSSPASARTQTRRRRMNSDSSSPMHMTITRDQREALAGVVAIGKSPTAVRRRT